MTASDRPRRDSWKPTADALRRVLMDWDPIGVAPPDDEYDGILWPVYRSLEAGADVDAIAALLEREVADRLGITGASGTAEAAARLVETWRTTNQ